MRIVPVDPRDTRWGVDEVLEWARYGARRDQPVTVFVRVQSPEGPGLVRLTGWDPTRNDAPPTRAG